MLPFCTNLMLRVHVLPKAEIIIDIYFKSDDCRFAAHVIVKEGGGEELSGKPVKFEVACVIQRLNCFPYRRYVMHPC